MPRTILVGLDGSPYGKAAVELGISWAKHWNAMLVGMGVIDQPSILQPEAVPVGAASAKKSQSDFMLADSRRKVEGLLETSLCDAPMKAWLASCWKTSARPRPKSCSRRNATT